MIAAPLIFIAVGLVLLLAIWLVGALPAGPCKLHDWQPEQDGRLRCAKCQRRPSDD